MSLLKDNVIIKQYQDKRFQVLIRVCFPFWAAKSQPYIPGSTLVAVPSRRPYFLLYVLINPALVVS